MALQDIITNLGTAIINLVNVRITKAFTTHDSELEEILLDLKAKVDELAGDNTPDIPVTPTTEEFDINGYTGTITTLSEDDNYVTIYEFNPVLSLPTSKFFSGDYDKKPVKIVLTNEQDVPLELQDFGTGSMGSTVSGYNNTHFQISARNGSLKQLKLYNENTERIDVTRFYTISEAP
ncbi:MAG: hypothetical protein ACLSWI_00575 [Candidatus Gastranaerophilaceae bacterium]